MEFHLGRTIDHVHMWVSDLAASRRFHGAVLCALGRDLIMDTPRFFSTDELFVSADGTPTAGLHVAFQADGPEAVARFHAAGVAAGGKDNGSPVVVTPAGGPTATA